MKELILTTLFNENNIQMVIATFWIFYWSISYRTSFDFRSSTIIYNKY